MYAIPIIIGALWLVFVIRVSILVMRRGDQYFVDSHKRLKDMPRIAAPIIVPPKIMKLFFYPTVAVFLILASLFVFSMIYFWMFEKF